MSDTRWLEIGDDLAAAVTHFARSLDLVAAGGFGADTLEGYRAQMALMHAMQSGHTSLESMLVRILDLLLEDLPTGANWHADLIGRAARATSTRPAIPPPWPRPRTRPGASVTSRCEATACSRSHAPDPPWTRPGACRTAWARTSPGSALPSMPTDM